MREKINILTADRQGEQIIILDSFISAKTNLPLS